jgi:hypothetical protein
MKKPKFKIGDKVKVIDIDWKKFKGSIWNCYMNEPNNLKKIDGEISYVVKHDNYKGNMVMSYTLKESQLILDI